MRICLETAAKEIKKHTIRTYTLNYRQIHTLKPTIRYGRSVVRGLGTHLNCTEVHSSGKTSRIILLTRAKFINLISKLLC